MSNFIEKNKHIPTDEIKQDILETLGEIRTMQIELKSFELLKDRMSYMRA